MLFFQSVSAGWLFVHGHLLSVVFLAVFDAFTIIIAHWCHIVSGFHRMGGLLKVARTKTHSLPNFLIRAGKELGYPVVDANGKSMNGEWVG